MDERVHSLQAKYSVASSVWPKTMVPDPDSYSEQDGGILCLCVEMSEG